MTENYQRFQKIAKDQGFTIPNMCNHVVPLFVSNLSKLDIPNTNPISLSELREVLQKTSSPLKSEFKILFDSGIEETFISLPIKR